ncbi:hypothetical protein GYH30_049140 [Glycine max]|nr:hypothetical protein GYH30_049140 [Glycine max]
MVELFNDRRVSNSMGGLAYWNLDVSVDPNMLVVEIIFQDSRQ